MHESSILNMFEDAWNNPEFISCIFNLFDQPGQYSGSIQAKTPLETIDCLPGIIFTYLYLLQECQIRRGGGGIAKTLITRLKLSFSNSDIGSPKKVATSETTVRSLFSFLSHIQCFLQGKTNSTFSKPSN